MPFPDLELGPRSHETHSSFGGDHLGTDVLAGNIPQSDPVPHPDTTPESHLSRPTSGISIPDVLQRPEAAEPTASPNPDASDHPPSSPPSPSLRWLFPSAAASVVELEIITTLPEGDTGPGLGASVGRATDFRPSSHQRDHHVVDIASTKEGEEGEGEEGQEEEEESAITHQTANRLEGGTGSNVEGG